MARSTDQLKSQSVEKHFFSKSAVFFKKFFQACKKHTHVSLENLRMYIARGTGLPDGIFSNQKIPNWVNSVVQRKKLLNFMDSWSISLPFGIVYDH
jgi:hypothetical protein